MHPNTKDNCLFAEWQFLTVNRLFSKDKPVNEILFNNFYFVNLSLKDIFNHSN